MAKFNALLNLRLKQKDSQSKQKITALAERSNSGQLSSFSGVFRVSELTGDETEVLSNILKNYETDETNIESDLTGLIQLTSEVKAITNQAVMLHGERIKKAHELLKNYKEGAFTAWMVATYGNRQTPYNFLQYYEFYTATPAELHPKLDSMPRQAIYTLASRAGEFEQKTELVKKYQGEPKALLLSLIRQAFPLNENDKRSINMANQVIATLFRIKNAARQRKFEPTSKQINQMSLLIEEIKIILDETAHQEPHG